MRYAKTVHHARMRYSFWQIEYLVVAFDEDRRKVKLSLRQADILRDLAEDSVLREQGGCVPDLQAVQQYACVLMHIGKMLNQVKSW